MLRCEDLARMITSDELAETGWRKRFQARLHLLACRHCRRYVAQLRQVRNIVAKARKQWGGGPQGSEMSKEKATELQRIERQILRRSLDRPGEKTADDDAVPK